MVSSEAIDPATQPVGTAEPSRRPTARNSIYHTVAIGDLSGGSGEEADGANAIARLATDIGEDRRIGTERRMVSIAVAGILAGGGDRQAIAGIDSASARFVSLRW